MEELALRALRQLLLFAALLAPVEVLFPARPEQGPLRRGLWTDLGWAALAPFVVGTGATLLLSLIGTALSLIVPGTIGAHLSSQPMPLQFVEIVVLGELGGYAWHRAAHNSAVLWRFHAVHHSAVELDWLSAHRQHPVESVILLAIAGLPVILLGFDTTSILGFILFQKLHTAFVHANLALPPGAWERWFAGPRYHRWHHSADAPPANFSSLFPAVDRLFGTFALPPGQPERLGVYEPVPESLGGQILYPFRWGGSGE